jgi:hypothetical protein
MDIPCVVYKLTCELTNRVYYGSTKNSLNHRASKGWYKCTCKDFVNPKKEVVYFGKDKEDVMRMENYYICNFDCVNQIEVFANPDKQRERNRNNINKKICNINYRKRLIEEERFKCDLCELCFQSAAKLERHIQGYRHKLKNECFMKYGEDWKYHYLDDNKKRYNKTRRELLDVECECGRKVSRARMKKHLETTIHKKRMANLSNVLPVTTPVYSSGPIV